MKITKTSTNDFVFLPAKSMYKSLLKPLFFQLSPERAHHLTFGLLKFASKIPGGKFMLTSLFDPKTDAPLELFGLQFRNKVGLAAGLDKNGEYIDQLAMIGFGHVEVGTVTPLPQPGNPKPRLFRLKKDEAIINRMGFNNYGVEALVKRLKSVKSDVIVGANIGKNKITSEENAISDYLKCVDALHEYCDYFTINVSSPNTPNLRNLQAKEPLRQLLSQVKRRVDEKPVRRPILLKIAPDLSDTALDDVIEIVKETGIEGIIATNTTIERTGLKTDADTIESIGAGGLSGKPLFDRSTAVLKYIADRANGQIKLIGVGGIRNADDAQRKIDAGADLVQVYSGMIYEGPALIKSICERLNKRKHEAN